MIYNTWGCWRWWNFIVLPPSYVECTRLARLHFGKKNCQSVAGPAQSDTRPSAPISSEFSSHYFFYLLCPIRCFHSMVVIASLGAELLPGDFILAHCNELTFESMAVCQLIDVILPSSLEVLWWIPPVQAQPLCPNRFVNLLKCKVVELSPSTSSVINNDYFIS